jgi:hypothetical protein
MKANLPIFLILVLSLPACFKTPPVQLGVVGNVKLSEDLDTKTVTLTDVESGKVLREYRKDDGGDEKNETEKTSNVKYEVGKCYAHVESVLNDQGDLVKQYKGNKMIRIESINGKIIIFSRIYGGIVTKYNEEILISDAWWLPSYEATCETEDIPAPHLNSCFILGSKYLKVKERDTWSEESYTVDVYDFDLKYLENVPIEKTTLDTLEKVDCDFLK